LEENTSVLTSEEIDFLISAVYENYDVTANPKLRSENPDDLSTEERILELSKSKINRLSIGIQSFLKMIYG
jgi:oxygen-independent coproporphyrinogen-3 oxidase